MLLCLHGCSVVCGTAGNVFFNYCFSFDLHPCENDTTMNSIRVRDNIFNLKFDTVNGVSQLAVLTDSCIPLIYVLDDGTHFYAPLGHYFFDEQKLKVKLFFYSILRGMNEGWSIARHIRGDKFFLERSSVHYPLLKIDDILTVCDEKHWKTFQVKFPDYDVKDGIVIGEVLWIFPKI